MRIRAGVRWRFWPTALLVMALLGSARAHAQPATSPSIDFMLAGWQQTLESVERQTTGVDILPLANDNMEKEVQTIISRAYREQAKIESQMAGLRAEAGALAKLEPNLALSPDLEQRREFVVATMRRDEALLLEIRALRIRAQEALRRIGDLEQARLQQEIRIHTPSPFLTTTWQQAAARAATIWTAFTEELANQPLVDLTDPRIQPLFQLLGTFVVVLLVSLWLRRIILNKLTRSLLLGLPTPQLALYPAIPCAASVLAVLVTGMLIIHGNVERVLIGQTPLQAVAVGLLKGLVALTALVAAARTVLAFDRPEWSLVPLTAEAARSMGRAIWLLASVFVFSSMLLTIVHSDRPLYLPLIGAAGVIDACAKAACGWAFFAPRNWRRQRTAASSRYGHFLRWVVLGLFNVPLALAAVGHAELGEEIVARAMVATLLFGSVAVLRSALLNFISGGDRANSQRNFPLLSILVDLVILAGMAYLALLLLNISRSLIDAWISTAADGFVIGSVTISARSIVTAVLATLLVLLVTRFAERMVLRRLLAHSAMDIGVRDAVTTGVRYVGIAAAIVVGIASLGLSLSNVALFASALSVGIGFGLRAIVENFVAGLLLLFERPIRAGDWIVVGDKEGIVRRISARATEVETFDRATVIIPNSQLITGSVVNWTHADRVARVNVKIVVPSGSPAHEIRQVLLECADEHPHVLKAPLPTALFLGFDDKALTFELRCFVNDATYYASVRSDLNFAIDKRVRRITEDMGAEAARASDAEDTA